MASISTLAPLGRAATCTALRAGGSKVKSERYCRKCICIFKETYLRIYITCQHKLILENILTFCIYPVNFLIII